MSNTINPRVGVFVYKISEYISDYICCNSQGNVAVIAIVTKDKKVRDL